MFLIDQRIFVKTWINKNKYDKLQWLVNIHLASGTRFPNFFSNILSLTLSWQFIISLYYTNLPNNSTFTLIIILRTLRISSKHKIEYEKKNHPSCYRQLCRTHLINTNFHVCVEKKKKNYYSPPCFNFFPLDSHSRPVRGAQLVLFACRGRGPGPHT